MASLLEIKKQIAAIRNTRKITKAMQLVATSRMKHLQKTALGTRRFATSLVDLIRRLDIPTDSLWQTEPASGQTVFILYSSDKGLCGSLNQQLVKTLIASPIWQNTPEAERYVIVFGKKGSDFLRFRGIKVDQLFSHIPDHLTPLNVLEYIDAVLGLWQARKTARIYMVAPHYKNSFVFYPTVKQFLPLTPANLTQHLGPDHDLADQPAIDPETTYIEPDPATVMEEISRQVVQTLFLQAFYELKATEYSSRMIAMQNATQAAEKLIDSKVLVMNGLRQQKITQEIAEITGSATVIN